MRLRAIYAVSTMILSTVYAQETPVGMWQSIDDHSKKPRAEIRISDSAGVISGRIEKRLDADAKADDVCDKCKDDRKDKPVQGLEIIRKVKQLDSEKVWGDGEILDPENGKTYKVKLTPIEGGKKLQVRGYIGPFYRTQVWVRVQ